eukprot:TRINITY_DN2326_c0_g1_i3.p1 TRINITY_DN2326_c0_g1~~TRINITY_DN2326_c0_g1_i3.p1  ORF type:complete len:967 (+),score=162.53 TRINITY_DN2326_c0_g1_i3:126-2903(+)
MLVLLFIADSDTDSTPDEMMAGSWAEPDSVPMWHWLALGGTALVAALGIVTCTVCCIRKRQKKPDPAKRADSVSEAGAGWYKVVQGGIPVVEEPRPDSSRVAMLDAGRLVHVDLAQELDGGVWGRTTHPDEGWLQLRQCDGSTVWAVPESSQAAAQLGGQGGPGDGTPVSSGGKGTTENSETHLRAEPPSRADEPIRIGDRVEVATDSPRRWEGATVKNIVSDRFTVVFDDGDVWPGMPRRRVRRCAAGRALETPRGETHSRQSQAEAAPYGGQSPGRTLSDVPGGPRVPYISLAQPPPQPPPKAQRLYDAARRRQDSPAVRLAYEPHPIRSPPPIGPESVSDIIWTPQKPATLAPATGQQQTQSREVQAAQTQTPCGRSLSHVPPADAPDLGRTLSGVPQQRRHSAHEDIEEKPAPAQLSPGEFGRGAALHPPQLPGMTPPHAAQNGVVVHPPPAAAEPVGNPLLCPRRSDPSSAASPSSLTSPLQGLPPRRPFRACRHPSATRRAGVALGEGGCVSAVVPRSAAALAGLCSGQRVVSIDGAPVSSAAEVELALSRAAAGGAGAAAVVTAAPDGTQVSATLSLRPAPPVAVPPALGLHSRGSGGLELVDGPDTVWLRAGRGNIVVLLNGFPWKEVGWLSVNAHTGTLALATEESFILPAASPQHAAAALRALCGSAGVPCAVANDPLGLSQQPAPGSAPLEFCSEGLSVTVSCTLSRLQLAVGDGAPWHVSKVHCDLAVPSATFDTSEPFTLPRGAEDDYVAALRRLAADAGVPCSLPPVPPPMSQGPRQPVAAPPRVGRARSPLRSPPPPEVAPAAAAGPGEPTLAERLPEPCTRVAVQHPRGGLAPVLGGPGSGRPEPGVPRSPPPAPAPPRADPQTSPRGRPTEPERNVDADEQLLRNEVERVLSRYLHETSPQRAPTLTA